MQGFKREFVCGSHKILNLNCIHLQSLTFQVFNSHIKKLDRQGKYIG